jgi:S2P endopeptidase
MSLFARLPPWIGFLVIWLAFNVLQWAMRWLLARRYASVMNRFGLTMDWSGIEWKTTRVNKTSSSIASFGKRFWRAWFSLGAIVSVGLMLFAVALVFYNLGHIGRHIVKHSLRSRSLDERINAAASTTASPSRANLTDSPSNGGFVLTPLLPGINLPLSQLGYLIMALAINALFHEAGHAIAASTEEVRRAWADGLIELVLKARALLLRAKLIFPLCPGQGDSHGRLLSLPIPWRVR